MKINEFKEITLSFEQSNIENSELYIEIQNLNENLMRYKIKNIENIKYKVAVEKLQAKGVLNKHMS